MQAPRGITLLSFDGNGGDGLAAEIYYPDATDRGRWGLLQADRFVPGETYPVYQISNGYCRGCAAPAQLQLTQIGTISLVLSAENGGQGQVDLNLTYPGAEGGTFSRTGATIIPGSEPAF